MGKGIAVIFFVVGFIIFWFIKHAATGVKAAYKVVSEDSDTVNTLIHEDKLKTIVLCGNCAQKLSVPSGKKGKATCPTCHTKIPIIPVKETVNL